MRPQVYPFSRVGDIYRPMVPIRIINANDTSRFIDTAAILDTGADSCVFPKFVPDRVNHELKGEHIQSTVNQGVGEATIQVWRHSFIVKLYSPDRKTFVWTSKTIEVGCVDHDRIPPLLGFSDFMCNFKISFNHATKRIVIEQPLI